MAFLRRLLLAFQFMTRIPLPFDAKATETDFAASSMFYPVTSLAVGGISLLAYWLLLFTDLPVLSAFAAVMAANLATGALHLDGFADCCDAFFSRKPKEDILRILKDSRMGTFGVLGIIFDVVTKTLLLYALYKQARADMAFVILCTPVAGKLPLIIAPALAKYARPEGTGKNFVEKIKPLYIVVCILLAGGILALFFGKYAGVTAPLLLLDGALIAEHTEHRIGGITGDVLGAENEIGEMLFMLILLVAYAF